MKIALIDDDPRILEIISDIFELQGYKVETYDDPQVFLGRNERMDFPVVITDYKMPGMTGIELMEAVRKRNPEARIIITTGFEPENALDYASQAGAYAFFAKPFEMKPLLGLLAKIEAELAGS